MKLWDSSSPLPLEDSVVCLGQFDGVHLGHAALIEKARQVAEEKKLLLCVHTFDPPPSALLRRNTPVQELTPLDEKIALLESLGVEAVAVSRFDEALRDLPGEVFFRTVLLKHLRARHLIAGFHHVFGSKGDTNIERLSALCKSSGIGLDVISPVTLPDGRLISSTAIRQAIQEGNHALALEMLGHPIEALQT